MKATPEAQNPMDDESGVKKALDDWLKPSLPAAEVQPQMDGPVNDLSKLVKKKKRPTEPQESATNGTASTTTTSSKRKVEVEEMADESREKKAKLESD
jgi:hypothetical protein